MTQTQHPPLEVIPTDLRLRFFFTLVPAVLPDNTRRAPGFEKKCLRISMTQTHPAMCQGKMLTSKTLYALSIDANDT